MTLREYLESWDKEELNEGFGEKIKSGFSKIGNFINKHTKSIVSKICMLVLASITSFVFYTLGEIIQFQHDVRTLTAYEKFEDNIEATYKDIQKDLILKLNPKYQKIGGFDLSNDKDYFGLVEELDERLLKTIKEKKEKYIEAVEYQAGVDKKIEETSMKKAEKGLIAASDLVVKYMREEYKKFLKEKGIQ